MKRIALFPGSFDPFTAGHLNILTRALTMFDEVVIAIGINQDKTGFFSNEQKKGIIFQAVRGLENVRVIEYDGLTVTSAASSASGTWCAECVICSTLRTRGP